MAELSKAEWRCLVTCECPSGPESFREAEDQARKILLVDWSLKHGIEMAESDYSVAQLLHMKLYRASLQYPWVKQCRANDDQLAHLILQGFVGVVINQDDMKILYQSGLDARV